LAHSNQFREKEESWLTPHSWLGHLRWDFGRRSRFGDRPGEGWDREVVFLLLDKEALKYL
jgi:hypothetical protein